MDTLKAREDELSTSQKSLATAEEKVATADKELLAMRATIDSRQATRPEHERRIASLRAAHQQTQALIQHRESAAQATALARHLTLAEETRPRSRRTR